MSANSASKSIPSRSVYSERPRMIANFAVTYRCNSKCRTCNIWKIKRHEQELSLKEIQTVFRLNHEFLSNVRYIQITGGEPFLRTDLPEIVSVIKEHLPHCTFWIPTNGSNPELVAEVTRQVLDVVGRHGLGVSVSVDGIEATHDALRGVDGSFSKAIETLDRLASIRKNVPGLDLTVGMTLSPDNHRDLLKVFELARQHDAEFSFRPVNFSEIYYRNSEGGLQLRDVIGYLARDIKLVERDLVKRRGVLKSITAVRYMDGALDYVREPFIRRSPCTAGSASMFIDPYGNVYPCIIMNVRLGNVRDAPLEDIWRSQGAQEARLLIREGKCPGCWVECESFRDISRDYPGMISSALKGIYYRLR